MQTTDLLPPDVPFVAPEFNSSNPSLGSLLECSESLNQDQDFSDPDPLDNDALINETRSLEFEMLTLQLSIESGRYSFMSMFMQKILNVNKDAQILVHDTPTSIRYKPPFEILPLVSLPYDLWLNNDVSIADASEKIALLTDVNSLLQGCLADLSKDELVLVDDEILARLEKTAMVYFVLAVPGLQSESDPEQSPAISPCCTYRQLSNDLEEVLASSQTAKLYPTLKSEPQTPLQHPSNGMSRMPSFHRESAKTKRKHSFLAHLSLSPGPLYFDSVSQNYLPSIQAQLSPTAAATSPTRTNNPSFFSKSKLYTKMKKRRELLVLALSVSTNGTTGASSIRRASAILDISSIFDINEAIINERHLEIQTHKHAYYVQVRMLRESVSQLLGYLKLPGVLACVIKLLDFVKAYIFKVIMVDICQMLVNYGHAKVVEASR